MSIVKIIKNNVMKSDIVTNLRTSSPYRATKLTLAALLTTLPLISSSHAADFTIVNGQTETNQNITLFNGDTGTILEGGTIEDANNPGIFSNENTVTVDNAGTITSTNSDGIKTTLTLNLYNRSTGIITGGDDGVSVQYLGPLTINEGIIQGGNYGLYNNGFADVLINSGTIKGTNQDGIYIFFGTNNLINSGNIQGGNNGITSIYSINNLENSGTISGANIGVYTFFNDADIVRLINSNTITGGHTGISAGRSIGEFINSGTITAGYRGILANTNIDNFINSGSITGLTGEGVRAGKNILSLTNTGSIFGKIFGVSAGDGLLTDGIISLTNAGAITGGDIAIFSAGGVNTHLILNPGSDIYGGLDLGDNRGINTLTVGKGLSIDHVFASLPEIINPSGQPLFIDGTRVVVVATDDLNHQQDIALYDLTQGIWGTVFNNIGDGRNPGSTFANNGTTPQFNLGALSPGETPASYNKSHMWAGVFGSHRTDDDVRHNLGGLIVGLDGTINSSLRMGAFFGTSRTDVDFNGTYREMETDTIFGGLYASMNAQDLTIDLGITGGKTENEGTRIVDNNRVNGLQTITSDFDGTFIAPELAIKTRTKLGGVIFQPTLSIGYAGLFMDGYTESGTNAAPLKVGENDIHIIHARLEIAALMRSKGEDSLNFQFSPYIGIKGRSLINGEATNISLFGANYNFNNNGDDDIGSAFAGFRISVLQTETFGIFAGLEGSVDTESSTLLTTNAGLKWRF